MQLTTKSVSKMADASLLRWFVATAAQVYSTERTMQLTTKSVSKMADASLLHAAVSQDLSASYSRALDTVRSKLLLKVRN